MNGPTTSYHVVTKFMSESKGVCNGFDKYFNGKCNSDAMKSWGGPEISAAKSMLVLARGLGKTQAKTNVIKLLDDYSDVAQFDEEFLPAGLLVTDAPISGLEGEVLNAVDALLRRRSDAKCLRTHKVFDVLLALGDSVGKLPTACRIMSAIFEAQDAAADFVKTLATDTESICVPTYVLAKMKLFKLAIDKLVSYDLEQDELADTFRMPDILGEGSEKVQQLLVRGKGLIGKAKAAYTNAKLAFGAAIAGRLEDKMGQVNLPEGQVEKLNECNVNWFNEHVRRHAQLYGMTVLLPKLDEVFVIQSALADMQKVHEHMSMEQLNKDIEIFNQGVFKLQAFMGGCQVCVFMLKTSKMGIQEKARELEVLKNTITTRKLVMTSQMLDVVEVYATEPPPKKQRIEPEAKSLAAD
jgi:hypothetical protein